MILQELHDLLFAAKTVEELFGNIKSIDELRDFCRPWYKLAHIDSQPDRFKTLADKTFRKLNELKSLAENKLELKTYGQKIDIKNYLFQVKCGKFDCEVREHLFELDVFQVYETNHGTLKISKDNCFSVAAKEAKILPKLKSKYCPEFIDQSIIADGNQQKYLTLVKSIKAFVPMQKILDKYPQGVDARDAAWMINRMLEFAALLHNNKYIHCGILPHSVLFDIEKHGIIVIDWTYCNAGVPLPTIGNKYKDYYPQEVFNKQSPSTATDLYMIGKCALSLLGGKGVSTVPKSIYNHIDAWLIVNQSKRPSNLFEARDDFAKLLIKEFGPPKFRKFSM